MKRLFRTAVSRCKTTEVMDGNRVLAHVSYALTDNIFLFPITPSSTCSEWTDIYAAQGKENCFGDVVSLDLLQSEGGVSGAIHGSASAGAYTTTYTCAQGLLLMIPSLFRISGELLPAVFHVSARGVAKQAHTIFNGHCDVMAIRSCGLNILASSSVQEAHDFGIISHLVAIETGLPWVHMYDGFRTSHEYQKIEVMEFDEITPMIDMDSVHRFKKTGLNPEYPVVRGSSHPPAINFQNEELPNIIFDKVPGILKSVFKKFGDHTGRYYAPFEYYGSQDAEVIAITMCSGNDVFEETIDYLEATEGKKYGLINVRLFRPWSAEDFLAVIPKSAKKLVVLEKTKETGGVGEPLYLDVCTCLLEAGVADQYQILGGRYGICGKDFDSSQARAVYQNAELEEPKNHFTVGINDDVSFTSIPVERVNTLPEGTKQCVFYGYGSDGTVVANQKAIEIIGLNTDLNTQAFFVYDPKKSGGVTRSHLRFSPEPIKSRYLVKGQADYVAAHHPSYVDKYDMLSLLRPGGVFVLNSPWSNEELDEKLPDFFKKMLAEKEIHFYNIDAHEIAREVGLPGRTNMVMQTLFFSVSDILDTDKALELLRLSIVDEFKKKGEEIVDMNLAAVEKARGLVSEVDYPQAKWAALDADYASNFTFALDEDNPFRSRVHTPMARLKGDGIPVSAFLDHQGGVMPTGGSRFDKRRVALEIPTWHMDDCIQCGTCSFVCPHSSIRTFLETGEEAANSPEGWDTLPIADRKMAEAYPDGGYRIQISPFDCQACENCVNTCPVSALSMITIQEAVDQKQEELWEYGVSLGTNRADGILDKFSVNGLQYRYPYLEFPGSCAGCPESAYVRTLTQLYGSRMVISNPAGCASIWTKNTPSHPLCKDEDGHGPTYSCPLFENNAEFGFGVLRGHTQQRKHLLKNVETLIGEVEGDTDGVALLSDWVENYDDLDLSKVYGDQIKDWLAVQDFESAALAEVDNLSQLLAKVSNWIIGGDGWAYDINFGGLIHVLAKGDDTNVFVLDTEIYSNTGGQASKATQIGANAKFAHSGKRTKKMDLGEIVMSLQSTYVASVSFANPRHLLKSINEAEQFDGPSCVIAYCPCIGHGIEGVMKHAQQEQVLAVKSGYWPLYNFDPTLDEPFTMVSKKIDPELIEELLLRENRFQILRRTFPEDAKFLQDILKEDLVSRYEARMKRAGLM